MTNRRISTSKLTENRMYIVFTMERALIVLLVGLVVAFFVNGEGGGQEDELDGPPQGVKAYVGRKGGAISVCTARCIDLERSR